MRRFELSEGTSNKFWQIDLSGDSFTVTFGRIGTNGQTQTKSFDTATKAEAECEKLVKEKVKKGYAEVSTDGIAPAAPVAPKPKAVIAAKAPATATSPTPAASSAVAPPAPPAPAPPPIVVEAGVAWTPEALREVVPRKGWDLALARKADAKSAFSRIREGFELAAKALEKGIDRADADKTRMTAARAAFGSGVESKLDLDTQAVAYALVAPRFLYNDRSRGQDFIRYWSAIEGADFALRALALASSLHTLSTAGTGYEVVEVALLGGPRAQVDPPWFRTKDDESWRALRHAVLAEGEDARPTLEATAAALRPTTKLTVRAQTTAALERGDWAREDLDEALRAVSQHGAESWMWPLLLCLPFDEAEGFIAKMASNVWVLMQGFDEIRFELVSVFGPSVATRLTTAMKEGASTGTERLRSLGEALALVVTSDVVAFFLQNLVSKELRAIASAYLVTHADASLGAVAHAACNKGPLADSARAVLRAIVASKPDAVASTKPSLSGAALALVETLEADSAPREEAATDELPRVLQDPPWQKKVSLPAAKVVKGLSLLPHEETVQWKPGEQEELAKLSGWMAPRPEEREKTLGAIRDANITATPGRSTWQLPASTLFSQLPAADAPKAFNEATLERFGWAYYGVVETLVARHGLAVLPGVLRFAEMDLAVAVDALRRVGSPRVAPAMAEAYARLKKSRDLAAEWLVTFPEHAAVGLIPNAVGETSSARSNAEVALRLLSTRGQRGVIEAVAKRYGGDTFDAIVAVLDSDPLLILPKKIPSLPNWFNAGAFTRPLLAGRAKALSLDAVQAVGTMLAFTSWDEPYVGLLQVKAACDPRSLADFAWDLFQAWLVAGAPSKESWGFLALGLFGDDDCARKLTPLVRAWPGEAAHARAVTGLDVLARIGTDVALMHLHGIAQKVKFKGLQEKAREKIDQIAEARGLSGEELADRLVPDLGLEDDGTLWLDFGPRKFKVVFDESLKPAVVDETSKRIPDLPKAKQTDDAEKAKTATDTWKALKKDAKTIAQGQILRLELAMCSQRRWSEEVFRTFLLEHPLLVHLVRRLVWTSCDADGKVVDTFRVAEDSSLANAEDDAFDLATGSKVGIAHRLEIGDGLAGKWGQVFADYEILQPFEQLSRGTTTMSEGDRVTKALENVKGLKLPTGKVLGLDARGWRRGPPQDGGVVCWYEKHVQGGLTVSMDLEPGIFTGIISESPEQTLGTITVSKEGGGWYAQDKGLAFGDLSPIVFSELVRDLESLRS